MTMDELIAEMERLRKENELLKAQAEVPSVGGRVLTAAERERFRAHNAKLKQSDSTQSTEADTMLGMVAKIHNLREQNSSLRKKKK